MRRKKLSKVGRIIFMRTIIFVVVFLIIGITVSSAQTPVVGLEEKAGELNNYSGSRIWTFETDQTGITATGFNSYVGKWQIVIAEKVFKGNHVFAFCRLAVNSKNNKQ